MRFVATADWQLGMPARFLGEESRARFAQARLDAVAQLGEVAESRGAEFIVVCGDVFDSNQLDRAIVARALGVLRTIAVPVYLLPGNHDSLDASSIYRSDDFVAKRPPHVTVLDRPGVHRVADGVEIVAAPLFSRKPTSDPVAGVLASLPAPTGAVRVLAAHGQLDVLDPDRDNPASIAVAGIREALDAGLLDVAVLGDRHLTTEVDDRIWYPGAHEVTDFAERDPGNVLVIEVDAEVVTVETVHVGSWAFTQHEAQLDGVDDVERLKDWFDAQRRPASRYVKLSLRGTLSIAAHAQLETVLSDARDVFGAVELWRRHTDLAVLPDDADVTRLGLTGFAQAAVEELAELVTTSGDRRDAEGALSLLYRLRGGAA